MGRKSLKEVRQTEIINAFYEVAKETGLENASIAKVARHLDINPSLIIHYFKTREELLLALINFTLERYKGMFQFDAQHPTAENLKELIHNLFSKKWNELFDDGVFYSCYALSYRDDRIKNSFRLLHESLRGMLTSVLEHYQRHNIINVEDVSELAEQVFVLIEGAYYYLGMLEGTEEYQRKIETYRSLALNLISLTLV
ncbi:TetR family transcriptional regulator [Fulvivirga ulvae]|uniref:TetR family transcriptional regulator n=1 Tax=Fulvivirga ulvae TaxID=2904245 RepID=UPI001F338793|nr:TetR family transcriptional regulator [Fulvivirga ulvae]UII32774.1 TetR family transcriptional regulator [Fulvivirga ulvae]